MNPRDSAAALILPVDEDALVVPSDFLPDSRCRVVKNRQIIDGTIYIPVYCANCGAPGGGVPEENMTFAFYLCDEKQNGCFEKYGLVAGLMAIPDEVFFAKIKQAQMEKYGRLLTLDEFRKELDDVNSTLSKLAREEKKGQ